MTCRKKVATTVVSAAGPGQKFVSLVYLDTEMPDPFTVEIYVKHAGATYRYRGKLKMDTDVKDGTITRDNIASATITKLD